MIRFLSRRVDAVGTLADTTLAQLGLVSRVHNGVVTEAMDRTTLGAVFRTHASTRRLGVGVVDQTGELAANLRPRICDDSTRSFRLALPVAEFISRRKATPSDDERSLKEGR